MIFEDQILELSAYRAAERTIAIKNRNDWAPLVVFGDNQSLPIHDWFRFKEGFSASLLGSVVTEFSDVIRSRELIVLDPFCGVGTTVLSAQSCSSKTIHGIGIERNPFIHFVASTKLRWMSMNATSLVKDGLRAISTSNDLNPKLPSLSSVREGRCISVHIARRLIAITEAAMEIGQNRDFVNLGVAASIESLSRVRRDGRALRIVKKPIRKVEPVLREMWASMARDVTLLRQSRPDKSSICTVILGDGRDPAMSGIPDESVDLIVTSPPYPNNIDYSEVYKLELWLLGFVRSAAEFLALRRSTVRSHPTYERTDAIPLDFEHELLRGSLNGLLGGLLQRLENSPDAWRAKMLSAYFADMWRGIGNFKRTLTKDGIAALVVGNSLHGNSLPALVATDLILARIAECHGMNVHIAVVRPLKRRLSGNHFLRESIVIMKKC